MLITLQGCKDPEKAQHIFLETSRLLVGIAVSLEGENAGNKKGVSTEALEQQLLVLEDQLFAALQAFTLPETLLALARAVSPGVGSLSQSHADRADSAN